MPQTHFMLPFLEELSLSWVLGAMKQYMVVALHDWALDWQEDMGGMASDGSWDTAEAYQDTEVPLHIQSTQNFQ